MENPNCSKMNEFPTSFFTPNSPAGGPLIEEIDKEKSITTENLTPKTNAYPNAFPELPLDCTDIGRSMSLKPKRPRLSSITGVGGHSQQQKDKPDEEENLKEMEHGACHKDTTNNMPPPHFETAEPATRLCKGSVGDDDIVTVEVSSRSANLNTSNALELPIESPYCNEHGRGMSLKPKRPRLLSSTSIISHKEKQQESTDNECEDIAMDIEFNISFSHENRDNIRTIASKSPQHHGTIDTWPASSMTRIHAHDQGSIEMAKDAARYG